MKIYLEEQQTIAPALYLLKKIFRKSKTSKCLKHEQTPRIIYENLLFFCTKSFLSKKYHVRTLGRLIPFKDALLLQYNFLCLSSKLQWLWNPVQDIASHENCRNYHLMRLCIRRLIFVTFGRDFSTTRANIWMLQLKRTKRKCENNELK